MNNLFYYYHLCVCCTGHICSIDFNDLVSWLKPAVPRHKPVREDFLDNNTAEGSVGATHDGDGQGGAWQWVAREVDMKELTWFLVSPHGRLLPPGWEDG